MKLEAFIMAVIGSWKEIVNEPYFEYGRDPIKVPLGFLHHLNTLTEHVDYRCNFNDGVCKNIERFNYTGRTRCCCGGCRGSIGYLSQIPRNLLQHYADCFDEEVGFWRPKTGCILPRSMRSPICLRYHCNDYDNYGKLILLPTRSQVIIELISHPGCAFKDYEDWYYAHGRNEAPHFAPGSFEIYVNAWVKRIGDLNPVRLFNAYEAGTETWREYYEKSANISKPKAVSRGGQCTKR